MKLSIKLQKGAKVIWNFIRAKQTISCISCLEAQLLYYNTSCCIRTILVTCCKPSKVMIIPLFYISLK